MILFSSEALSDIERVRNFLETRNPDAAVRACAQSGRRWNASKMSLRSGTRRRILVFGK
jgi:plasmid stabilization system protein ParE